MTTPSSPTPWYRARWFWALGAVLLILRIGYKWWRQEQRPSSETRLEQLTERSQSLKDRIRASQDAQRAAGAAPVLAAPDTAVAADSAARP